LGECGHVVSTSELFVHVHGLVGTLVSTWATGVPYAGGVERVAMFGHEVAELVLEDGFLYRRG
jgi:hypothetical protein